MAERSVLRGNLLPQIPAVAGLQFRVKGRGSVLAAVGAAFDAAAVGDEQQVVFGQVDHVGLPIMLHGDGGRLLARGGNVEANVRDLGGIVELHAVLLQVLLHRQDDGFVLVIAGEAQCLEVRQTADVVDEALDIELHFQRAVPVLEGEHRAPVHPEVGGKHLVVEHIGDTLVIQLLIRREEKVHDFHRALVGDGELAVRVGILPLLFGRAAQGEVRVFFVQPVILVQHACAFGLNGRDGAEQIPHDLEVVVHFAAAAHHVADIILPAVARAAGHRVFLENVDVLALHLTVAHQIACRRQGCQTCADNIGALVVNAFRLLGMGKGFIVTAGIIHKFVLLQSDAVEKNCCSSEALFISLRACMIPRFSPEYNKQTAAGVKKPDTNGSLIKAPPCNSAARLAMSFPPSAACKFLDVPPVNLRNLHLHLTKNPYVSRPPHLCGVTLELYCIIFPEQNCMPVRSNQIISRPNRMDC